MNIQIFGRSKCFDTKKAERYFKERKIKFQSIDLPRYGMSAGEFTSVLSAIGSVEELLDEKAKDAALVKYLAHDEDKKQKLLGNPSLIKTPVVRSGKKATVGYCPEIWETWE